ncbi:RNA polymerase sigma factor [Sorangium sp. So ce1099]|uniref:RNA polymerase sigma factor n=1 Tax=Sorangium sp. So ce1099 TaxID=3133331 RepID=UPI003F5E9616
MAEPRANEVRHGNSTSTPRQGPRDRSARPPPPPPRCSQPARPRPAPATSPRRLPRRRRAPRTAPAHPQRPPLPRRPPRRSRRPHAGHRPRRLAQHARRPLPPHPALPPADALRTWLAAIASRQASHYRDKAYRRHEAPPLDPHRLSTFASPSPEERLVARGLLRAFHRLRPELREVLSLAAAGLTMHEIAAALALPRPTVATRLRLARRLFARSLTRWRRWPR